MGVINPNLLCRKTRLIPAWHSEPPLGGDITLCSSDGTSIRTHSLLIALASSDSLGMFSVGTHGDGLIDLAEDAETVSLMLEYI